MLMGLLKDCQSSDVAVYIRKADANCQKQLRHTRVKDIKERCNSRSALTSARSLLGGLPTSSAQLCETADADGLEIHMNEDWCDVEFRVVFGSGSQDHVCNDAHIPGHVGIEPGEQQRPGLYRGKWRPAPQHGPEDS